MKNTQVTLSETSIQYNLYRTALNLYTQYYSFHENVYS